MAKAYNPHTYLVLWAYWAAHCANLMLNEISGDRDKFSKRDETTIVKMLETNSAGSDQQFLGLSTCLSTS